MHSIAARLAHLKSHGARLAGHSLKQLIAREPDRAARIPQTFTNIRINVPKAPPLGLLLERTVYDCYNKKWATEDRAAITFEPYAEAMQAFKEKWIYSTMMREEREKTEFAGWLAGIDAHAAEFEWYLRSEGGIDPSTKPPHIMNPSERKDEEEL